MADTEPAVRSEAADTGAASDANDATPPAKAAKHGRGDVSAWNGEEEDDDAATGFASRPQSPPVDPGKSANHASSLRFAEETVPPKKRATRGKVMTKAGEKSIRHARRLARNAALATAAFETPTRLRAGPKFASTPPPRFSTQAGATVAATTLPALEKRFVAKVTASEAGWARRLERERVQRDLEDVGIAGTAPSPVRMARTRHDFVEALRGEASVARGLALASRADTTQRLKVAAAVAHEELLARQALLQRERAGLNAVYRKFTETTLVLKTVESGKLAAHQATAAGPSTTNGEVFLRNRSLDAFRPPPTRMQAVITGTASVYARASKAARGPGAPILQRASYRHPLPAHATIDVLPPMLPYANRLCTVRERFEREDLAVNEADARACMLHNFHSMAAIFKELDEIGALKQNKAKHDTAKKHTPSPRRRMTLLRVSNRSKSIVAANAQLAGHEDVDDNDDDDDDDMEAVAAASAREARSVVLDVVNSAHGQRDEEGEDEEESKGGENGANNTSDGGKEGTAPAAAAPPPAGDAASTENDTATAAGEAEETPAQLPADQPHRADEPASEEPSAKDPVPEPATEAESLPPVPYTLHGVGSGDGDACPWFSVRPGLSVDDLLTLKPLNATLTSDAIAALYGSGDDTHPAIAPEPEGAKKGKKAASKKKAAKAAAATAASRTAAWVRFAVDADGDGQEEPRPALSLRVARCSTTQGEEDGRTVTLGFDVAVADGSFASGGGDGADAAPVVPLVTLQVAAAGGSLPPHVAASPSVRVTLSPTAEEGDAAKKTTQAAAHLTIEVPLRAPSNAAAAQVPTVEELCAPVLFIRCVERSSRTENGTAAAVVPWQPIALPVLSWLAGAAASTASDADANDDQEGSPTTVKTSATAAKSAVDGVTALLRSIGQFKTRTTTTTTSSEASPMLAGTLWGCAVHIQLAAKLHSQNDDNGSGNEGASAVVHTVHSMDRSHQHRMAIVKLASESLTRWVQCAGGGDVESAIALHSRRHDAV